MTHLLARNLDASHLGIEVSVPLSVGASVTDVLTDLFHSSRQAGFDTDDTVPMTLLRFKNTRPAPDWRLSPAKPLEWLTEFFEVAGTIEVVVHDASTDDTSTVTDPMDSGSGS